MRTLERPPGNLPVQDRWFGNEVRVPRYMNKDQNLFDQPPYAWMFVSTTVFPPELFMTKKYTEGRLLLFDLYVFHYYVKNPPDEGRFDSGYIIEKRSLRDRLIQVGSTLVKQDEIKKIALEICNQLHGIFGRYPYAKDYLKTRRYYEKDYNRWGRFRHPDTNYNIRTYAAFASDKELFENQKNQPGRWAGLAKELPGGYSNADTIGGAMPAKAPTNRYYRLVDYSEALK